MVDLNLQPEQKARVLIDEMLRAAGWQVQNYKELNLAAAPAIAVREFPVATGEIDYLLYVERKAIGTIEAKKAGETLRGVEWQVDSLRHRRLRRHHRRGSRLGGDEAARPRADGSAQEPDAAHRRKRGRYER